MTYPGLEPPTCEFATQAALARRHLERIARASGADPRKHVVGTVAYVSDAKWMRAAREVWAVAPAEGGDSDEDEDLQVLKQGPPSGLLAVVAVPCLPRNGLVEYVGQCTVGDGWQAEYLANVGRVGEVLDSDDEEDARVIAHWKGGPQQAEAHFESPGMWAAEVQARRQGAVVVAFTRVSLEGAWEVMEAAKLESVLQEVRSRLTSTLRQVKCGWEQALMVRAFVVVGEESVAAASQALQTAFHDCATSLAAVDAIETGASILLAVHGHSQPLQ
ncbi:hypothetical protein BCR44DRAFT_1263259 [Catenaria anguillulae PL171]|uniref:Uncharacterized protein n=1 Tax=Catenaria anguillulae PL171 TaxID=765915 RepID=A0A1Y2HAP0_9FUNG|nr:hypothetical protein BCR44DRAFT_1263259 [Catenaria anguillulae PL171]